MACACKVNSDLAFLQKKYGVSQRPDNKKKFEVNWKEILYLLINFFVVIVFLPLFVLHVLFGGVFSKNKNIDIAKVFRLKKH
jgi:hypothetical protein